MQTILSRETCGYLLEVVSKRIRRKLGTDRSSLFVQIDYDFPGLARTLGWNGKIGKERCRHDGTDGTVSCPDCGRTAMQFITAAAQWLDAHDGCVFNKGGEYFSEDPL